MNMKTGITAILAFCCLSTSAQETKPLPFTKEDLIADYRMAMDILKKQHPNPYKFIDSVSLERKIDSLLQKAQAQTDAFTCQRYSPIQLIRDVHTNLSFSEESSRDIYAMLDFFPIPVVIEREKIFVNIREGNIPFGSEVIKINNMAVKDIIASLSSTTYSDGYINTGTDRAAPNFQTNFSLRYPGSKSFDITYMAPGSTSPKKITVPSANPTQAFHAARLAVFPLNLLQRAYLIYRNYDDETKTGLLTVNTFNLQESMAYKEFAEFFKEVNRRGYKQVIIDIRSNSGGNPAISALLYSFMAKGTFRNVYNYRTQTIDITYPEHAMADNSRKMSDEDIQNTKNFLYQRFNKDSSGFYVGNERLKEGMVENFPSDKEVFNGKVYVLTGGGTVSAATYFASLVQKNKRGEVIGKETGSGENATTAAWFMRYMLPKTKSILTVPMSELYFFNSTTDNGRGIIPNREVAMSKFVEYLQAGKDPEMTYTLELIRSVNQ